MCSALQESFSKHRLSAGAVHIDRDTAADCGPNLRKPAAIQQAKCARGQSPKRAREQREMPMQGRHRSLARLVACAQGLQWLHGPGCRPLRPHCAARRSWPEQRRPTAFADPFDGCAAVPQARLHNLSDEEALRALERDRGVAGLRRVTSSRPTRCCKTPASSRPRRLLISGSAASMKPAYRCKSSTTASSSHWMRSSANGSSGTR